MSRSVFAPFYPLLDAIDEGIIWFERNAVVWTAIIVIWQITMVDTDRRPNSVLVLATNFEQHLNRTLMVRLDQGSLIIVALRKGDALNAAYSYNIVETPGVVERLWSEEGNCNELVDMLCKHAFPQLSWISIVALLYWSSHFYVGDLQNILEPNSIWILIGNWVNRIDKDARVRNGPILSTFINLCG
jgi:hypothetical protein